MAAPAGVRLNQDPAKLIEHGYVVIPDVIAAADLDDLNRSLDGRRKGTIKRTRGFVNERELLKDRRFFDIITQPRVVETVREALGDGLQILDFGAMEDPPGTVDFRSWHSDFHHSFPVVEWPPLIVTLLVYLADMTDERGPLFVRPGSHRLLRHPNHEERGQALPDELKISVPAGTAIAFHANLWHTGSPNATDSPRRLLFSMWGQYWMKRLDEFYKTPLPDYILNAEDPLPRQLFGVELAAPSVHGTDYNSSAYGG